MSVFDLDQDGEAAASQASREPGITPDEVTPGFLDGAIYGAGMGLARGAAKTGRAATLAVGAGLAAAERVGGYKRGEITNSYFDSAVRITDEAVDFYTPNASEVGTAGRVIGNLAEIVAPLAAGAGNPSLLIGSTGLNTTYDLAKQGVDAKRAVSMGMVDAAAVGIGFRLPFLGTTFLQKAATGAATNLALGAGATAADRAILESGGYSELADQYNPLDIEARTVDLLTGIAFGGLAHAQTAGARAIARSERDAALAALNAKHYQNDTAPGRPADDLALVAHQDAIETALRQLQEGKPVEVGESRVTEARFLETPPGRQRTAEEISALEDLGIKEPAESADRGLEIPRAEVLSSEDRLIESRFIAKLRRDPEAAMREYAAIPDSGNGKILNTDIARELSPEYLANRTKSAAVHEPASAIVKEIYKRKLAEEPGPGEQPLVVFSAGGTGAGKTTGLELTGVDRVAQIVYDSNMNSLATSVRRIEMALDAGKQVQILYTFRDPVEALTGGALPRAVRQEREFGSGRTVPVSEHAKTHLGASKVVREIAEKYKNNPRVKVKVVDNSLGKGKAAKSDLSIVPKVESADNQLTGALNEALDAEFKAGRISEAIYTGFKGESATLRPGEVRRAAGEGSSRPTESSKSPESVDPDVIAAERSLEDGDILIDTGEVDADGNSKTVSARDALAAAREEIATAEREASAFEAAVACALSFGGA